MNQLSKETLTALKDAAKRDRIITEYEGTEILNYIKYLENLLKYIDENAENIEDRDANPVFEIQITCDWQLASKGILYCIENKYE